MHIKEVRDVQNPIRAPWGETVYELVGTAPTSGSAVLHSLAHIVIAPNKASTRHYHKVSEETYYILSGNGRMIIEDQTIILSSGQACLIKPFQVHQIFNDTGQDLVFLAVCAPAWTPGDSFASEG